MRTKVRSLMVTCILTIISLSTEVFGQQATYCPAPSVGPITIFYGALDPGWNTAWSWGNSVAPSLQSEYGNIVLKMDITAGSGGLELHTDNGKSVSTANQNMLTFMFKKDMAASVTVGIRGTDNTVPVFVPITSYVVANQSTLLVNGQWYNVAIPLADLQASNKVLGGVVFYSDSPGTMYVNAVVLSAPFLRFPLECSAALSGTTCPIGSVDYRLKGAYTASSVVSVMDHSMKLNDNSAYPYGKALYPSGVQGLDGIVLAWTGEMGQQGTPVALGCYPRLGGGTFSVAGTYLSETTCTTSKLNYDDHPGYDYRAALGTPVKAAAAGTILNLGGEKCFKNNLPNTCNDWGAVGIDHGNGYITQYLHMNPSTITVVAGQSVAEGQVIGYSSDTGVSNNPHLHFEVLKKVPGSSPDNYKMVDPYGWEGTNADPLQTITGQRNFRLWK